jgi:protein-S-isoprenylcysteine O-methyltransferase Ste14
MLKVMLRLIADATLTGIVLFSAAGTVMWWRAWLLLGLLLLIRSIGALVVYRANPALLRERARLPIHTEQPRSDKLLLIAVLAIGFLGVPAVAGLDVFHWRVLPRPSPVLAGIGLLLFAFGWGLKSLALRANAFATSVLRLQSERAHAVVDTGVYRVIRHPFYAADPLIFVGLGLWLGSYVAAFSAIAPVGLVVLRLRLEERFLRRELPGYVEYSKRVPHRLIPGVW